jgi:dephospho-CoA kinase
MLRVGLTGGLGSGKSTVAGFLRALGAEVIEADELGRALMEPGHAVYTEIVHAFGPEVVGADGRLNRARLADLVFQDGRGNIRLGELNAIVHPAVIAAQQRWMEGVFQRNPAAVAVIESALIFEVERDARARGEQESVLSDWRRRIDRVVVVTAPDEKKVARYIARRAPDGPAREAAEADARRRMAHQIPDAEKAARADYIIDNNGDIAELEAQVRALWHRLKEESNNLLIDESLK